MRARSALDVLAQHQFPEGDSGGCTAHDGWGLCGGDSGTDNEQIAEHQLAMLAEAGFTVVRS